MSLCLPRPILIRLALFWVAFVIAMSLQPWRPRAAHGAAVHQLIHLLAFGVMAMLLLLVARTARQRLLTLLAVISLGIAIEGVQHCAYGSPLEWWDMRDDVLAAAGAWPLAQWTALRRILVAPA